MGQPDDREAVVELGVGGLEEGLFEAAGLPVGELDSDHEGEESLGASVVSSLYEPNGLSVRMNRKASAGLCIQGEDIHDLLS